MFMHRIISDLMPKLYVDSYKLTLFLLLSRQIYRTVSRITTSYLILWEAAVRTLEIWSCHLTS